MPDLSVETRPQFSRCAPMPDRSAPTKAPETRWYPSCPSRKRQFTRTKGRHRMFSRVRIAIRFFFVGLAVGILLAPRSGEETRRLVRERADRLLNDVLDAATLGTYESGAGAIEPNDEADEDTPP